MSLKLNVSKWMAVAALSGLLPWQAAGQSAIAPQGAEYPIVGRLAGDQTKPQLAIGPSGGFLVWQDNATDGDGLGINARRLNSNLTPSLGAFRVNFNGVGDQENPQVALLQNGGAVFVWQGGKLGFQKVYARFMTAANVFIAGDVLVSSYAGQQINPVAACLPDGSVVISWASFDQDGDMQGVFAQRFSSVGARLGSEFQVNQTTDLNQRTPAVAVLDQGRFVLAWVSEQSKGADNNGGTQYAVDVFARLYAANASPVGDEFKLNDGTNVCANPSIKSLPLGGFVAAWSENFGRAETNGILFTNGWEVVSRTFDAAGNPASAPTRVNTTAFGDQYGPRLAPGQSGGLMVWTSMGQDGSWEGVYGRSLTVAGIPEGDEFLINNTTASRQMHATVGSDAANRFLVCWISFTGGLESFDLFARQYSASKALVQPDPPFVSALPQSRLSVTWPALSGLEMANYEVYLDDATTPVVTTNTLVNLGPLLAGSTHSVRLLYELKDGSRSPKSDAAVAATWGDDANYDGLPDDWQAKYWGSNSSNWPAANVDSDLDGATNLQEFLAGTNPVDENSVLKIKLESTPQGWRLQWNTERGFIYQVQKSTNINVWENVDVPRLAAEDQDSLPLFGEPGPVKYYRVIRLR
jgi:hypothetical protein